MDLSKTSRRPRQAPNLILIMCGSILGTLLLPPRNFKVFCAAFNRLQDQCRVSAFVDTVGKAHAAFDTASAPASGSQHARSRMATPRSGARWDGRVPRSFAA